MPRRQTHRRSREEPRAEKRQGYRALSASGSQAFRIHSRAASASVRPALRIALVHPRPRLGKPWPAALRPPNAGGARGLSAGRPGARLYDRYRCPARLWGVVGRAPSESRSGWRALASSASVRCRRGSRKKRNSSAAFAGMGTAGFSDRGVFRAAKVADRPTAVNVSARGMAGEGAAPSAAPRAWKRGRPCRNRKGGGLHRPSARSSNRFRACRRQPDCRLGDRP